MKPWGRLIGKITHYFDLIKAPLSSHFLYILVVFLAPILHVQLLRMKPLKSKHKEKQHAYPHNHTATERNTSIKTESLICFTLSCEALGRAVTHPQPFVHWPQGTALINTDSVSDVASISTLAQ